MAIDHKARAKRAWPVLKKIARKRGNPVTYGDISYKIGLHHRSARWFLGVIQTYCKNNGLPPLQALVVNKKTRLPGSGYYGSQRTVAAHHAALKKVYAHNWKTAPPNFR